MSLDGVWLLLEDNECVGFGGVNILAISVYIKLSGFLIYSIKLFF